MPWQEQSIMTLRHEFVRLAEREEATMQELCRRFGISRQTGDTWLRRYLQAGAVALADRSRRPQQSPGQTAPASEARVVSLRERHPAWGGRTLRARLLAQGHTDVPSASTITAILRRHGRLDPAAR